MNHLFHSVVIVTMAQPEINPESKPKLKPVKTCCSCRKEVYFMAPVCEYCGHDFLKITKRKEHNRMQPCGPNRSQRKLIRIKATFVNR